MASPDLWPEHEINPETFDAPVEIGTDKWRVHRIQRAYCNPENYRRRNLTITVDAAKSVERECGGGCSNDAQLSILGC